MKSIANGVDRRRFSKMLFSAGGLQFFDWQALDRIIPALSYPRYDDAVAHVLPAMGYQSKIALKDSILNLMEHGVIDRAKFFDLYGMSGPLPVEFENILSKPSDDKILLASHNASIYVNLLWPVGLATQMAANAESPMQGDSLYNFASTGGWTLGREQNGGAYFNKFPIVKLTDDQEALVVRIAKSTFRPCCNNSTFFQDCNHGSALLGILQLGASQGLSEGELYREALAFNSFWFSDYYLRTALYFKVFKKTDWSDVVPQVALGFYYSAGGPWQDNVAVQVDAIPDLIPSVPGNGADCGV